MDNIRNESTSNEDMTSAVLGWTISVAMFATAIAMIWFVGTQARRSSALRSLAWHDPSHPDPDVLASVDFEQLVHRKHPFATLIDARVVVLWGNLSLLSRVASDTSCCWQAP